MPLLNPHQQSKGGTFTQVGEEPLSKQVIGIRLPESIHAIIHPLPNRTEWLRRVIVEAVQRELLAPEQTASTPEATANAAAHPEKNATTGATTPETTDRPLQ